MNALIILAYVPVGFVVADCVVSWRRVWRTIRDESLTGLPKSCPMWMVNVASVLAGALFVLGSHSK